MEKKSENITYSATFSLNLIYLLNLRIRLLSLREEECTTYLRSVLV